MKEPLLKSVMTPFPYSIELSAPILAARRLMLQHSIRHLPVVSGHALVGIVSDRDIKLILGPELGSPDPHELTVEDAYVGDCYSVEIDTPLRQVLDHMGEAHLGAVVVTLHGRLAGIFTAVDACQCFARHLHEQFHGGEELPPIVA